MRDPAAIHRAQVNVAAANRQLTDNSGFFLMDFYVLIIISPLVCFIVSFEEMFRWTTHIYEHIEVSRISVMLLVDWVNLADKGSQCYPVVLRVCKSRYFSKPVLVKVNALSKTKQKCWSWWGRATDNPLH